MKKFVGIRVSLPSQFSGSVILALTFILSSCSQDNTSSNQLDTNQAVSPEQQDWVKEELLTQVTGLRKELAELRVEVKALDGKVPNLKVADNKPSRPAAIAPKEIPLNDPYAMGDDSAKVIIIEFTDYQCPYCARHSKGVLPEIKKNFVDTGKIQYAIRDYPLGFHAEAKGAAISANCAGEQGKYWEMHDVLFDNPRNLSKDFYQQQVAKLDLNLEKFQTCVDNPASATAIDQSIADGSKYGVSGTPKSFIGVIKDNKIVNIKSISGAQGYNVFAAAIEERL